MPRWWRCWLPIRCCRAGDTRRSTQQRVAWLWTAVLAVAAAAFACWIAVVQGHERALEWAAGYTIETSLSIDNLFVFMVLFQGFRISRKRQHHALLWGVAGAVVLRALFIAAGVTLIQRFDWVTWILGRVSALCGVAAGARRLGQGSHSGVDSQIAAGQRVPCCR